VYIWNRDLPSVGHVMVTDHNSAQVIVNQFPMKKIGTEGTYRARQGFNQIITYQEHLIRRVDLPQLYTWCS